MAAVAPEEDVNVMSAKTPIDWRRREMEWTLMARDNSRRKGEKTKGMENDERKRKWDLIRKFLKVICNTLISIGCVA